MSNHPDAVNFSPTMISGVTDLIEEKYGNVGIHTRAVAGFTMDYINEYGFPQSPANVEALRKEVGGRLTDHPLQELTSAGREQIPAAVGTALTGISHLSLASEANKQGLAQGPSELTGRIRNSLASVSAHAQAYLDSPTPTSAPELPEDTGPVAAQSTLNLHQPAATTQHQHGGLG